MRIGIVGSGISGLTCAWLLHEDHEVTLFEAGDHVGGHTNTVEVEGQAVDTGFIVFNEPNYPSFVRMLNLLGVESQPTSMSFSVRCDRTGTEYNGTSLNTLFAQRSNLLRPRFWGMLRDIVRFGKEAPALLDSAGEDLTVEGYVRGAGYGEEFVERYLVPLGASLWSCPARRFRQFPVRFVVEFLRNHSMLRAGGRPVWRVICGGSARYVEKLTAGFRERIRLRCPVRAVTRHADRVAVRAGDGAAEESFDQVILACHADQALRVLTDPGPVERELLGAFPYQENEAILHTDTAILPRRRLAWASWNYHVRRDDPDAVAVTYDMNILQSLESRDTFCVTLNETEGIAPSRIRQRIPYEHPLYVPGRAKAQGRHAECIGRNRTSFCGAYWGYGFHEDGVRSALAVARHFGKGLPS